MEQMARAVIKKMCRVSDVKTDMLIDKPSTGYLFDLSIVFYQEKERGERSVECEVPTSTGPNRRSTKPVGITADN